MFADRQMGTQRFFLWWRPDKCRDYDSWWYSPRNQTFVVRTSFCDLFRISLVRYRSIFLAFQKCSWVTVCTRIAVVATLPQLSTLEKCSPKNDRIFITASGYSSLHIVRLVFVETSRHSARMTTRRNLMRFVKNSHLCRHRITPVSCNNVKSCRTLLTCSFDIPKSMTTPSK